MTPPPAIADARPAVFTDLFMLEALHAEPSLSQRQLAARVGLPLSKAHFVLRRLIERGMVKVRNVRDSKHKLGYLYVLTPRGVEAKAKLTYRFLQRTASEYQSLRGRVERVLTTAIAKTRAGGNGTGSTAGGEHGRATGGDSARVTVALLGEGPLAEVVRDVLRERGDATIVAEPCLARVAVIIDPEHDRPEQVETLVDFS